MVTVKFNNVQDSYEDFGLILVNREIGTPEVKRVAVDLPFANGSLDLSFYYGELKYTSRIIKCDFVIKDQANAQKVYSNFMAYTEGIMTWMSFSDDFSTEGSNDLWEYTCESMKASALKKTDKLWGFSVEFKCKPFKEKSGTKRGTMSSTDGVYYITCENNGMPAVPKMTAPFAEVTLTTPEGDEYILPAGETVSFPDIVLYQGTSEFTANGFVLIDWNERTI